MRRLQYILCVVVMMVAMAVVMSACTGYVPGQEDMPMQPEIEREQVELRVSMSTESQASRVAYTPEGTGLHLTWQADEQIGVYIEGSDKRIQRAGTLYGAGSAGETTRLFSGSVTNLAAGERYIYLHPNIGEETAIEFSQQTGALGSTEHLNGLVPLVWRSSGEAATILQPEKQGYVVHVQMQFKENPGSIRAITMRTMKRGSEDRIFPKAFSTDRLAYAINNSVANGTQGTNLSTDSHYTDSITLVVEGNATEVGTGSERHWEADAYIVCSTVENLNVFNTKYHVTADCAAGLFTCSEFLSFPGQNQEPASSTRTLGMLSDGKVYNLNAKLSKDVCNTVISENYGISSTLGMWDSNGVPYDPCHLKCTDAQLPAHLLANKAQLIARNNRYEDLTDLYKTHNVGFVPPSTPGDWKQTDVTTNNIDIVAETEVVVAYLSEYGDNGNKNLLGYYYYPTPSDGESAPSSPQGIVKYILLPNVTAIETFASYQLLYIDEQGYASKTFPAGVSIGFFLMINPTATDAGHSADFNLMKWSQWSVSTNSIWNQTNSNWRINTYKRDNFFASGDISTSTSISNQVQGLAYYAAKDRAEDSNNSWRMQAMHFVVATSNPAAMQTYNRGFINIGSGTLINNK